LRNDVPNDQRLLRIVHLEDEPNDAELVQLTLERAGLACHIESASTRDRFESLLERGELDLILSDFSMPAFDGFTALEIARRRVPDVPFIFVSGTLGEEAAVDSLKRGATDYVLKQRLTRLAPAAIRALEEADERRRRKHAEAGLEQERKFLMVVLDSIEAGVVACDSAGHFTLFNRAAREIHGIPAHAVRLEAIADYYRLFAPDGQTPLSNEARPLRRALAGERLRNVEMVIRPRDGAPRTVLASAQPIEAAAGERAGAVMAVHDISDRKRLEEQFRHAQKMEAIGRLAGGVAHDFNNLLTVIMGCSQMIATGIGEEHSAYDDLIEIQRAADRAASLTGQLLAFSRQQILDPSVLDLNSVVADVGPMLRRLIGPDVDLRTEMDAKLAPVKADRGQLQQVLLNLAVNARDAMPTGGILTMATHDVVIDAAKAARFSDLTPGRYTVLEAKDTGVGMDADTRARIFEPFYTTKEPGKGTGLGLSTVHGIVKQSGGHIEVTSEPGRGTTFRIYLPHAEESTESPAAPPSRLPRGGTEALLVVEDEDPVREYMKRTLRGAGYSVMEARDGEEAMRVCLETGIPLDLVITDVLMPRMRGTELARRLADFRPELKVLLVSGYPDPAFLEESGAKPEAEILQKPFPPHVLLNKVREVLETRERAA
jgi:PAS domain S-box-containing protein